MLRYGIIEIVEINRTRLSHIPRSQSEYELVLSMTMYVWRDVTAEQGSIRIVVRVCTSAALEVIIWYSVYRILKDCWVKPHTLFRLKRAQPQAGVSFCETNHARSARKTGIA